MKMLSLALITFYCQGSSEALKVSRKKKVNQHSYKSPGEYTEKSWRVDLTDALLQCKEEYTENIPVKLCKFSI